MKKIISVLFSLLSLSLTLLTNGCAVRQDSALSFSEYTNRLFVNELKQDTLSMHYTVRDPASYGITDYQPSLPDYSPNNQETQLSIQENIAYALKSYDPDELSLQERITYDILKDSYTSDCDTSLYSEILRPSTGFSAELPVLFAEYSFYCEQDIKDYLLLLQKMPDCFASICEYETKKSAAGLFMSDRQADRLISDINALCETSKKHYLLETFEKKIDALDFLTTIEKKDYISENEAYFYQFFLPSYQMLSDCLSELKGSGTNDAGLCYFPNGAEYYANLVYQSTGSSHTVDELLDMVEARRTTDISAIAKLLAKYPDISLESTDYAYKDASPEEILAHLTDCIGVSFSPPVSTDFTVNYVDDCMQESMAPAFYLTAPIDAVDQNVIYINPSADYDGINLFTTLAHEGYPGHLYQTTKTASAELPVIRNLLNYPGYVEGWATYVELLSYSYAGLPEEQAAFLMHNQSAILSLYATADLSIHAKGWTLGDTISFFSDYGISDAATVTEIYYYIVSEPAHYLKYYIGYLEFLNLKAYAQKELGDSYTDQWFHDAVLSIGPAPFEIIRRYLLDFAAGSDIPPAC